MRRTLITGAIALAVAVSAAPVYAQDGPTMWCQATADNGADSTVYYSAFFAGQSGQAEQKARAFKSVAEDEEVSAASVTAKCTAAKDYDEAVATRNAAMKAAPGAILDWAG